MPRNHPDAPTIPAETVRGTIGLCPKAIDPPIFQPFIFSRNRYGPYARYYRVPYHPAGVITTPQGQTIHDATALWHTMTKAQRDRWKPIARGRFSGPYTAFIAMNVKRISNGRPISASPT